MLNLFIGAALTGLFTVVGLWIGHRWERDRWDRDTRLKVYGDFLAEVDRVSTGFATLGIRLKEAAEAAGLPATKARLPHEDRLGIESDFAGMLEKKALVMLLGPDDVADAAHELAGVIADPLSKLGEEDPGPFKEKHAAFIEAAQRALR